MKDEKKSFKQQKEEELIDTTEAGSIELDEADLERVSGGIKSKVDD